jgi:hypothetical protein
VAATVFGTNKSSLLPFHGFSYNFFLSSFYAFVVG